MKILVVGDIMGSPGRAAFRELAGGMKQRREVDAVVANAENAAGGKGLTPELAAELFSAGADVLTLGDHAWNQKGLLTYADREPRLLRPANFAPGAPGRGWTVVSIGNIRLAVINLVGRVFLSPYDCPFRAVRAILDELPGDVRHVVIDMHAEATSEKVAMGRFVDGRVSMVVGTHTHVQTSDARVLAAGTGYLTDLGMTGPHDSVIGMEAGVIIRKFLDGMPAKFVVATGDVRLQGAVAEIDDATGKALSMRAVDLPLGTA